MVSSNITPIGVTNFRNICLNFGIKDKDRLMHLYVIGKSGTGKSTLLENMAISDIERGNGLCILDPHSDIATSLIRYVSVARREDLIYFNAVDQTNPTGFNPLHAISPKYHHLVASGLISTFKKIWIDSWGPRMEYILRFALLTLLQMPGATLLDIQPLLTKLEVRQYALGGISDPHILSFWQNEFDKYSPTLRAEAISPILNKMGLFSTNTILRGIVGQKESSFRLRQVIDSGKILIVNLSKGELGEDASSLLGAILINSLQLAALHRANIPENRRRPFYLYVDECHSFLTLAFANILSEARKYGLSLFLAHQYIEQLDERIRSAIFGNVGTIMSFRVGAVDGEYLAKEFYPEFSQEDFVNLPRFSMYIKLMIDGATSQPFSATTNEKKDLVI